MLTQFAAGVLNLEAGRFRLSALPRWGEGRHSDIATLVLRTSAAKTRRIITASKGSVSIKVEKSSRVTKPITAPFFATAVIEYGLWLTNAGKPRIEPGAIGTLMTGSPPSFSKIMVASPLRRMNRPNGSSPWQKSLKSSAQSKGIACCLSTRIKSGSATNAEESRNMEKLCAHRMSAEVTGITPVVRRRCGWRRIFDSTRPLTAAPVIATP